MKKLALIFLLFAAPASAQVLKDNKTDAMRFGAFSGMIAGNAYFCQVDEEDLDIYIGLAHARINRMAVDKADRIVGQLEFSNNYSLWAAQPPEQGCRQFLDKFYLDNGHLF